MVQDGEAVGSFASCLSAWGINSTTITVCAGACVAAGTANPVGIAVCAACLGTAEWIVVGCAMRSVWKAVVSPEGGSVKGRPLNRAARVTV